MFVKNESHAGNGPAKLSAWAAGISPADGTPSRNVPTPARTCSANETNCRSQTSPAPGNAVRLAENQTGKAEETGRPTFTTQRARPGARKPGILRLVTFGTKGTVLTYLKITKNGSG